MRPIYVLYDMVRQAGENVRCPNCNYIVNDAFLQHLWGRGLSRYIYYCSCNQRLVILKRLAEHIGLNRGKKGACCGCGRVDADLVEHHWWCKIPNIAAVPKSPLFKCTAMICRECNLIPALANGTHILPKWEVQLQMINNYYAHDCIADTSDLDLYPILCLLKAQRWDTLQTIL